MQPTNLPQQIGQSGRTEGPIQMHFSHSTITMAWYGPNKSILGIEGATRNNIRYCFDRLGEADGNIWKLANHDGPVLLLTAAEWKAKSDRKLIFGTGVTLGILGGTVILAIVTRFL